jgi:hypothetical protein
MYHDSHFHFAGAAGLPLGLSPRASDTHQANRDRDKLNRLEFCGISAHIGTQIMPYPIVLDSLAVHSASLKLIPLQLQ